MLEYWVSFGDPLELQSQIMLICGFFVLFVLLADGIRRHWQSPVKSKPGKVLIFIQACVLTLLVFMSVTGFFMFLARVLPGFEKEPRAIMLVVALLLVSGSGAAMYRRNLKKLRHASDTPTSKIRSAAQGYAELNGRITLAEGQPPLIAPLSGSACAWWQYEVRFRGFADKKCSTDSFYIDDGTGQCEINPEGAKVIEHTMQEWEGYASLPYLPPEEEARPDKEHYSYVERLLLPGHELYALGEFKSRRGQHLLEAPGDGQPFILSGRNEAELIDDARSYIIWGALLFIVGVVGSVLLILIA